MAARAVGAVRAWDARLAAEHGAGAVWAAVSHGDPIKAILADALGMHLDSFQRIVVDPASISIIRYTAARPYVMTINSTDVDLVGCSSAAEEPESSGWRRTGCPGRRRLRRRSGRRGDLVPERRSSSLGVHRTTR